MDTPATQPIPAPLPPKNNSGMLIGILLFLLGILVGLALDKTTLLSDLRIPYLTPTPAGQSPLGGAPTPTPDITATWKTYRNTTYNYSFKIPSDWVNYSMKDFSVQEFTNKETTLYLGPKDSAKKPPQMVQITAYNKNGYQDQQVFSPNQCTVANITIGTDRIPATHMTCANLDSNGFTKITTSQYVFIIDELKGSVEDQQTFTQILSTFKFVEQFPTVTPTVPPNWIRHTFNTYGLIMYTPNDWQSGITDFPENSESLVKFWKKSSPTIIPIQLTIKPNWDNTGYDPSQAKHATVDGNISAIRVDPPTKNQQTLERYQTNVYFEHNTKIYVFTCVHNWTQDYLDTCNTMLETLQFTK